MIFMEQIELKCLLETRLRNLKRKNAKLAQHAECADEYLEIEDEIQDIEEQLKCL